MKPYGEAGPILIPGTGDIGSAVAHDRRAAWTVRDGAFVRAGTKPIEVDLRGDPLLCFGLGKRPQRVAAAVLAVLNAKASWIEKAPSLRQ